jgi:flagellar basal body L-ring protein FlgH
MNFLIRHSYGRLLRHTALALCVFGICGCFSSDMKKKKEAEDVALSGPASPLAAKETPSAQGDGSLFHPTNGSLWGDDTAHNVGDIVTVTVSLDQSGSKSATTDLSCGRYFDVWQGDEFAGGGQGEYDGGTIAQGGFDQHAQGRWLYDAGG